MLTSFKPEMDFSSLLAIIVVISATLFFFFCHKFTFWSSRNVPGPTPWTPLGNMHTFMRKGFSTEFDWYRRYGKLYGYYEALRPKLTIIEPELIKQVLVKDFHYFVNRDSALVEHELYSLNLSNTEDEQWRRIRMIISPTFTTGKLRGMHSMMEKCLQNLVNHLEELIDQQNGEFNAKSVLNGFTIDVIASTSFAMNVHCNADPANPFLVNATELMNLNPLRMFSLFLFPAKFNKLINNTLGFSEKRFNFFADMSREVLKRRSKDSGRKDFSQLMMDAFVYEEELLEKGWEKLTASDDFEHTETLSKGFTKKYLTSNEIIAQCILFFLAGSETTSTVLTNALYHLATNPEIQLRLKTILDQELKNLDPNSNEYYEKIQGTRIPYLDAVLKETMRLSPPLPRLPRKFNGPSGYQLGGISLERGQMVDIGVYALHRIKEYFSEPEKFNPDRFMPENAHKIVPYSFLPMGAGPRNCLGMRFAYQEMRLCLAKLVRMFRFETCPDTKIPPECTKIVFLTVKNMPLKVSRW